MLCRFARRLKERYSIIYRGAQIMRMAQGVARDDGPGGAGECYARSRTRFLSSHRPLDRENPRKSPKTLAIARSWLCPSAIKDNVLRTSSLPTLIPKSPYPPSIRIISLLTSQNSSWFLRRQRDESLLPNILGPSFPCQPFMANSLGADAVPLSLAGWPHRLRTPSV